MGLVETIGSFLRTGVPAIRKKGAVQQFSKFDLIVPWWARYNHELFVREAYRKNPLVRACIEYRCNSVSLARMYAMRHSSSEDGDERLSAGHWMQKLLRRPSQLYPTQTRWVRQIERQLLITGECFIYLARAGRTSRVGETQILPGSAIRVIPGEAGIKRYEYRPDGIEDPIIIRPEEMIFLRYDDPEDPLRGVSPLANAWREIQADNSMTDYRKAFFDHAAIPGGILTTNLPANAEQLRQWSEDFTDKFSGPTKAGQTPALAGGLEYQRVGATPNEVDFGQIGAIPETRICMAFGMHPILVAAKVGLERSTYSNFKEAHSAFWEDTIVPEMEMIQDDMTVGLTQWEDPNFISFDTSKVPALEPDKEKIAARAKDALINGAITVNEYRKKIGENPVPDGDVYYRPGSLTPVPAGKLDEEPEPLALAPEQAPGDPTADEGGRPQNDDADQDKPPTPGSANDRTSREFVLGVAVPREDGAPLVEYGEVEPDGKLVKALYSLHVEQMRLMTELRFDRALYVAKVSGAVRNRLSRIAEAHRDEEWLDMASLELGNEMADLAVKGGTPGDVLAIAGVYTQAAKKRETELQGGV